MRRAVVIAGALVISLGLLVPSFAQDSCEVEREVLAKLVMRLTNSRSQTEIDLARTETQLRAALGLIERLKAEKK